VKPTLAEAVIPQSSPPRKQSPNSTSNPNQPTVLPLLGGEGRGEGELSSNCIVPVGERAGVRANSHSNRIVAALGVSLGVRTWSSPIRLEHPKGWTPGTPFPQRLWTLDFGFWTLVFPRVTIELINTGSELMLGRILNTHQQWICRQMADLGYTVSRQVAISDTATDIEAAIREALGRADLIITTGGLGPTSDDLTREMVAKLLGKTLREDPEAVQNIERFFEVRQRPMPDRIKTQALVPEGAIVLQNAHGLAPGVAVELNPNPFRAGAGALLIMLPGPPRELRPMFRESVIPLLRQKLAAESVFLSRTLRTVGIGESVIQEKIATALARLVQSGMDVGYCASTGQVDIRLAAFGDQSKTLIAEAEQIVRDQIGAHIFGVEEETLESVIIHALTSSGKTLALAESCTGGYIAHRLTNVPGASAVLLAGLVTYSNAVKEKFLGVQSETLKSHGAVSEPVALEMAEGARRETKADYAISVTGIAGPTGGTPDKPVGTVFIGLATPLKTFVRKYYNPYDRETFKQVTSHQALDLLRRKTSFSSSIQSQ